MDCDDVLIHMAADAPTLSGVAAVRMRDHIANCEACQELEENSQDLRTGLAPVVHIPKDALDDDQLLDLPVIDPELYDRGASIGAGGMGSVTIAHDRRLGRKVAIKEVLSPRLRARFEREANITARLQHPAIVPIYEAGVWPNGAAFYTMRLVPGKTLSDAIAECETFHDRLAILPHVIDVTEALAYAHSRRVIHRDLKPGNVLIGSFGETVVIDWGLAKELDDPVDVEDEWVSGAGPHPDLTVLGEVLGTPPFMPPEQVAGLRPTEQSDVYALGAMLYNVLTGDPPYADRYRGKTAGDILEAVATESPTPLATHCPEAPRDLVAIVEKAMARAAKDRYATAKEMAEDLRRFQSGQLVSTHEYSFGELLKRWVARHKAAVTVASTAFLVLTAVTVGAFLSIASSRDSERDARRLAESARTDAERSLASLLEEQGRNELLAGDRGRALAYLNAALERGRDTTSLRHLLAIATRNTNLLEHGYGPYEDEDIKVGFTSSGRVAVVDGMRGKSGALYLYDGAEQVASHPLGGTIFNAAFGPDGERLALIYTSEDRLALWDPDRGVELWRADGPAYESPRLAFRADGRQLVVVPGDHTEVREAHLFDVATGKLLAALTAGDAFTTDAAFSADGKRLATVASDGTLRVWDSASLELTASFVASKAALTHVALSRDGRLAAVGTKSGEAQLWDLNSGTVTHVLSGHSGAIRAVAIEPAHERIATADAGGAVQLWSNSGDLLGASRTASGAIDKLAFSPDGDLLAAAGDEDGRVFFWDTHSLAPVLTLQAHPEGVESLRWSETGRSIVTGGYGDHRARHWRRPEPSRVNRFPATGSALGDGTFVVASGAKVRAGRAVTGEATFPLKDVAPAPKSWSWESGRASPIQIAGKIALLAIPTGEFIDIPPDQGRTRATRALIYDLDSGRKLTSITAAARPILSPDGTAVLDAGTEWFRLFDSHTGELKGELQLPERVVLAAALLPAGDRVLLIFGDAPPKFWRIGSEKLEPFIDDPLAAAGALIVAPNGKRFVGYYGETEHGVLVDLPGQRIIAKLPGAGESARYAQFSGDGRLVATWSRTNEARLWDAETGALLTTIPATAERAVALSHDGSRLATGDDDGRIRIWESRRGRLLEVIQSHQKRITDLAFSRDGTRLLAQSDDGTATLWNVALDGRSAEAIGALADANAGWKLENGELVSVDR